MPRPWKRPDIPQSPLGELNWVLHELHHRAGWPSSREIRRALDDKGVPMSHTKVHDTLTKAALPTKGAVEMISEVLAEKIRGADVEAEVDRLLGLWQAASLDRHSPSSVALSSPAPMAVQVNNHGTAEQAGAGHEPVTVDSSLSSLQSGPCEYLVVHPDGTLDRGVHGGRRAQFELLKQNQPAVFGEVGVEHLRDMPSIKALWLAPYDRRQFDDNPVANHMIQVFDSVVDVPGECCGDVIFAPATDGEASLSGRRLDLIMKIYAEIRSDLAAGRPPRTSLRPSEMAIASRNL